MGAGRMADNSAAFAQIDHWIDQLNRIEDAPRKAAPLVARELGRVLQANIAAGRGPDGKPWPRRQDGKQALQNAAKNLTVRAIGTVVEAKITGHVARHHRGWVRGGIARQILPTREIPEAVKIAIQRVLAKYFRSVMGVPNG